MKPLVSTAGMKGRSLNEIEVLNAIPAFLRNTKGAIALQTGVFDAVQYENVEIRKFTVRHVRSVGLIESKSTKMIADSTDALIDCMDDLHYGFVCAGEVKTMTSLPTVNSTINIKGMYGPLIVLSGFGTC